MSSRGGRLREVLPVSPGGGLVVEGAGARRRLQGGEGLRAGQLRGRAGSGAAEQVEASTLMPSASALSPATARSWRESVRTMSVSTCASAPTHGPWSVSIPMTTSAVSSPPSCRPIARAARPCPPRPRAASFSPAPSRPRSSPPRRDGPQPSHCPGRHPPRAEGEAPLPRHHPQRRMAQGPHRRPQPRNLIGTTASPPATEPGPWPDPAAQPGRPASRQAQGPGRQTTTSPLVSGSHRMISLAVWLPAVRPVLPRRGGTAGRARRHRESRQCLPLGAAVHPGVHRGSPAVPSMLPATAGSFVVSGLVAAGLPGGAGTGRSGRRPAARSDCSHALT